MATFTVQAHINASPHVVFEQAADFRGAADRISGITRIEMLTEGPVRVGTRFKETRVMFGREHAEEMEVTDFDPPRRYALRTQNCGCLYRTEFRFIPRNGGTEVQMTFEATPLTLIAKMLSFLMRSMMKSCVRMVEKDLADLKQSIERPGGGSGRSAALAGGT